MKRVFFLGILVFFAGCMKVGPDFHPPCAPLQFDWIEGDDERISYNDQGIATWWEHFHDPVLSDLIAMAEGQNLTLRSAAYQILQARALLGIAIGEIFPQQQQLVGQAENIQISSNAPNTFFSDLAYKEYNLGIQLAWELDFWGRFRRGIEAARENLYASFANYNDVLVLLVSDVASTYITLRTLEERIEILERNIKLQKRSLEIVEARWEAGAVTELDVQQAKTLLNDTLSRLPALEASARQAKNVLATLLGITPEQVICILDEPGTIPSVAPDIALGIPAQLLCRRPDVRRALHEAGAQSALIGVAITDLLPRFSIGGFVGLATSSSNPLTKSGKSGHLFDADSFTFFFGPSFAWSILNYGRLTNRVRFEYARFDELVTTYQNTILVAYQETESALIGFLNSQDQWEYLVESSNAAARAQELAVTQYVEGLADYTRVLNSEQLLLETQERETLTRGDIALNLVLTYRALGGGWESTQGATLGCCNFNPSG